MIDLDTQISRNMRPMIVRSALRQRVRSLYVHTILASGPASRPYPLKPSIATIGQAGVGLNSIARASHRVVLYQGAGSVTGLVLG